MAKLYPPYLEGTIPAFYGDSITVPFAMNRAVGINQFAKFSLLIKTIQTGQQIAEVKTSVFDLENNTATFSINALNYKVGQSYKVQLAYVDIYGNVGYYSTVAVVKYTEKPTISIQGLNKIGNKHKYNYIGEYTTKDITEKMYSCQFKVYDKDGQVISDSGEIIHNSLNDEAPKREGEKFIYTATQQYNLNEELDAGKSYYIQFLVKTIGLMELDSGKYEIVQSEPIPLSTAFSVIPVLDYENGYISININSKSKSLVGKYVLARAHSKNNFKSWDEIMRFTLNDETNKEIWKDFTVEQGVQYKYSIFMVDGKNQYSTRIVSDIIIADFEDVFLFDGDKQLRIKFNPGVDNFKNNILETVSNTIGGKYPYIFRNGHVNHKEFSVSGLLTHLSDNDGYFEKALAEIKQNDFNSSLGQQLYSTNLNSENIALERQFKLEALDWLTNGKPKLFRSPTEGNYLVRLKDVSLSPEETLGRMIHSFSASATEIAEYTHNNLLELGIIKDNQNIGIDKIYKMKYNNGIPLQHLSTSRNYLEIIGATSISGMSFNVTSSEDIWVEINGSDINLKISKDFYNVNITSLKRSSYQTHDYNSTDTFTIYYTEEVIPAINNNINSIDTIEIPIMQFCGSNDIYTSPNYKNNLLNEFLCDNKEYISQIFSIQCNRRPVIKVKTNNINNWNNLKDFLTGATIVENVATLYEVYDNSGNLLGYKDQGISLKINEGWTTLENLSEQDKYQIHLQYKNGTVISQYVAESEDGLILDSSNVDFTDLVAVYGSLFFSVSFCCRLGSKNMNSYVYNDYETALQNFQNTVYNTEAALNQILTTKGKI